MSSVCWHHCDENNGELLACPNKGGLREHFAHKSCLVKWALGQRRNNVSPIICRYYGICKEDLTRFLPLWMRAANFFKTRPAVQILASGVPLIVVNAATRLVIAGAVRAAVAAVAVMTGIELMPIEDGARGLAALLSAAAETGFAVAVVADGPTPRNLLSAGAAVWSVVGASTMINGGGWPSALILSTLSGLSTYLINSVA